MAKIGQVQAFGWNQRFKSLLNEFPTVPNDTVKFADFGMIVSVENWDLW